MTDFTTLISNMPAGNLAIILGCGLIGGAVSEAWSALQVRRRHRVPGTYLIALLCFAFIATPSLYLILAQPSVLGAVSAAGTRPLLYLQ